MDLVTFTEEILNGKLHFLCSTYALFTSSFLLLNLELTLDRHREVQWSVSYSKLKFHQSGVNRILKSSKAKPCIIPVKDTNSIFSWFFFLSVFPQKILKFDFLIALN